MKHRSFPRSASRPRALALTRREVLAYGSAGLLAAAAGGLWSGLARAAQAAPWTRIPAAQELLAGETPRTGLVELELPLVVDDGSMVPLTVSLAGSPDIESLHLFASGNPVSDELATFRLSPAVRPLRLMTRIRLDQSQTVVALARTRNGEWLAGSRDVRVTVSGCLVGADGGAPGDLMRVNKRIPERVRRGESIEVLTLIQHPMETGLRQNAQGEVMPRRIIERFQVALDDELLLDAELFPAIAANPYLRFHLAPERSGELRLMWQEDTGERVVETSPIEVT